MPVNILNLSGLMVLDFKGEEGRKLHFPVSGEAKSCGASCLWQSDLKQSPFCAYERQVINHPGVRYRC